MRYVSRSPHASQDDVQVHSSEGASYEKEFVLPDVMFLDAFGYPGQEPQDGKGKCGEHG